MAHLQADRQAISQSFGQSGRQAGRQAGGWVPPWGSKRVRGEWHVDSEALTLRRKMWRLSGAKALDEKMQCHSSDQAGADARDRSRGLALLWALG